PGFASTTGKLPAHSLPFLHQATAASLPPDRSRHLTGYVRHTRRLSRPCTHIRLLHHVYVCVQHSAEQPAEGPEVKTSSAHRPSLGHRRSNHQAGANGLHRLRPLHLSANEIFSK